MNDLYVRDWMTPKPITVRDDASLPDAHQLMADYTVRRLPVVDGKGKLVGIIARSDVREAEPSDATTLSIYELNYLLAKLKIEKVMTRDVITVTPETTIAETAKLMLDHKVGGIPVVDGEFLVGIITESDIFRTVVQHFAPTE